MHRSGTIARTLFDKTSSAQSAKFRASGGTNFADVADRHKCNYIGG